MTETLDAALTSLNLAKERLDEARTAETAARNHVIDMQVKYDEARKAAAIALRGQSWFKDVEYALGSLEDS